MSEPAQILPKAKKSVALSGVAAGNTALVHGRPHRQRPALSRLRHPRCRDDLRVRGNRLPARARQVAEPRRADRVQDQAESAARHSNDGQGRARTAAGIDASDGRHAHGRFGARLRTAGKRGPQPCRRARHRRPADGFARVGSDVLAPLRGQRQAHRRRDRRRFDRRPYPAPAARQGTERAVGARDAHIADPVCRARVQCLDVRRARDRRYRQRHVLVRRRRDRRAARTRSTAARTKRRSTSRTATRRRTRPKPTSARASSARKS